ncbi:peptidase M1 [Arenibacter aquaticus]|uniref:Aminopeptidase N n=1 Tax=Arenibacter aquaticus TaxID=2489054 RepID=A0A3S0IKL1_9FLAO|nr:M1 family aminopeptidase [Arenibacter aquaticus]RTE52292.1 peptidase M1 [Arenibacter aquaticus]
MTKHLLYLFVLVLTCISCSQASKKSTTLNDTGVPLKMAEYRSQQIQDVVYHLWFNIPKEKELPITSKLVLKANINDLSHPLYLDFKEDLSSIQKIIVDQKTIPITFEKEHIIIPSASLELGTNTIEIEFIAGELSLNRNSDYLYTLLVPDRARTLFPCFDQPNIKAKYNLTIIAPKNWKVLAGASVEKEETNGETTTYQFRETDKMSTYLFSFVAGEFNATLSSSSNNSMNLLYRESNEEKLNASTEAIFKLHQSSSNFLEAYTQFNFPFQKFDFVTIPGFQYGGMEHIGAIQYRESSLFLDSSATRSQELSRAKLIAHETAHMWFGNLVTMQWFNDVWMKEVFANFMADKIVNPAFTDINHDLQFLSSHYPRAYSVDRTRGTNPIRQKLENLNNAGSLYGSIIYDKAPIVMRQLELTLGETSFREGIREYIATFAYKNADWNDLVAILDKKIDLDLKRWSEVWVNSTGRPVFSEEIKYDNAQRIKEFTLTQKAEDGSAKFWPQSFDIQLVYPDSITSIAVLSDTPSIKINEVLGAPKPLYVLYNTNGYGYGLFPTNEMVATHSAAIEEEVSRAHSYLNIYENTLNGTIAITSAIDNIKMGVSTESNELILRMLSGQMSNLFWNYLTDKQRTQYQEALEELLYHRLRQPESKNIKKTLYKMYRSIAYSQSGIDRLYRIWNKEETIENLVLNKDNYSSLAQQLALFGHPKAKDILAKAKSGISNPDKLERFKFLEPTLNSDPAVRTAFFKSFKDPKNREKENWVQTACSFIHHPLHQKEGIKSVGISLELLEEIQRTGDIFFPLGWLSSTIGKYTSKEAYDMVQNYIASHPELDENLMKKLLQATDNLYRRQNKNI